MAIVDISRKVKPWNQYIFRGLSPQSSPVRGAIESGSPRARGGMIRGGFAGR